MNFLERLSIRLALFRREYRAWRACGTSRCRAVALARQYAEKRCGLYIGLDKPSAPTAIKPSSVSPAVE